MKSVFLGAALIAVATPVVAEARVYRTHHVAAYLEAGCTVRSSMMPAGKTGAQLPVVQCGEAAEARLTAAQGAFRN